MTKSSLRQPADPAIVQRRLEKEEREQRSGYPSSLLDKALNQASDAVFLIDKTLHFVFVNEAACRSLGYSREELLTLTSPDIDPDVTPEMARAMQDTLFASNQSQVFESRHQAKDGRIFPVEVSASVFEHQGEKFGLCAARNISERKRMEEAEAHRAREFRTLAENSPDCINRFDRESRFVYVNPQWEKIMGLSADQVVGRSPVDMIEGKQSEEFLLRIKEVIATGHTDEMDIMDLPVVGGETRHHNIRFVAERGATGEISGVLALGRDITERIRLAEELQDKNAELERFTYTVSHDLKSPLVTIKSFSGSIMNDLAAGRQDRVAKDLGRIAAAADKMTALLDDLLRLSRIGRVLNASEPVEMSQLVQDALAALAGPLKESGVRVSLQPDLPTIRCDRQRMTEVVQNLVENAIKYRGEQPEPAIRIGLREDQGERVFFVQDNGAGIDPRFHETIFGLFNRLDTSLPGTGIGLALAKRIIEVHGGRIWAESDGLGRGSRFCFTLDSEGTFSLNLSDRAVQAEGVK